MFTGVNILVLSEGSCWLTGPNEGTKHSDEIEALLDTTLHKSAEIGFWVANSAKRFDKAKNGQSTAMPAQVLLGFMDHSTLKAYCRGKAC